MMLFPIVNVSVPKIHYRFAKNEKYLQNIAIFDSLNKTWV